jgi:excisionase family DNA binding protein
MGRNRERCKHFLQMKIDLSELVSIKEASEIRGVSTQAIYELIKRGRLTVIKVGGKKFTLRKEVEAFTPNITGRPRKDAAAAKSSQGSKAAKRSSASTTKSAKKKM